jgi:ribonuclease Z
VIFCGSHHSGRMHLRCAWPLAVSAALLCLCTGASAQKADGEFRVTLLGTGSPAPSIRRFGPSVLVQAGKRNLLIDCGRGATQRLLQAGVGLGELDAVFLTHLHSDHTVGIPDLWLTGWLPLPVASRKGAFRIYGPAGTKAMMENLEKAFDWDIRTRIADQKLAPGDIAVAATEFAEGVVYERDGVKVTAFEVDHGEKIKPAFGFRVDYRGHSVVISGDTRPSENLIKHAAGTDLLIHQVAAASEALLKKSPAVQLILAHHTRPEEAGVVFSRVKPKLAVLYHFSLQGAPGFPAPLEHDVFQMTRKTYAGPLLIGEDLMPFSIGRAGVTTRQ